MTEGLVALFFVALALSQMVTLDVEKNLRFIDEKLQERSIRKRQQRCRHSWQIEYDHPYSWCVRCQKFVPTESIIYLIRTGHIRRG